MAFTEGHAVWTYIVIVIFNVSLYVYKPREYKYLFFAFISTVWMRIQLLFPHAVQLPHDRFPGRSVAYLECVCQILLK